MSYAWKGKQYIIKPEQRAFWSFQPVKKTAPPQVKDKTWARTPVDAFILAKLEEKGLKPTRPADKRRVLTRLRAQIRSAAPEATESISYGLPTYKLDGRPVVYFGSAAAHVSLYAVGATDAKGKPLSELEKYDTSGKGTVRFPPDKPLPAALVTRIVKANVARIRKRAVRGTRVRSSHG